MENKKELERDIKVGALVINKYTGMVGTVLRFYKPTACKEQTVILVHKNGKGVKCISREEYHAPTDHWERLSYDDLTNYALLDESSLLEQWDKNIINQGAALLNKIRNEILEDMSIPAGLSFNSARLALGLPLITGELEELSDVRRKYEASYSKGISWSEVVQQSIKDVGPPSVSDIHKISKPEQDISEKYLISFDIVENDIPVLQIYQDGIKSLTHINTIKGENVKAFYEILTNKNLKGGK